MKHISPVEDLFEEVSSFGLRKFLNAVRNDSFHVPCKTIRYMYVHIVYQLRTYIKDKYCFSKYCCEDICIFMCVHTPRCSHKRKPVLVSNTYITLMTIVSMGEQFCLWMHVVFYSITPRVYNRAQQSSQMMSSVHKSAKLSMQTVPPSVTSVSGVLQEQICMNSMV